MEQKDISRMARPKVGEAEFFPIGSTVTRAGLCENPGMHLPSPAKGLLVSEKRADHEEDEELGPGRDVDANSNADSEKWIQPDGLEEQEFSIKEASFSEGSLKLKIQTTKRAKKPPKNLENYICPPEIRITIKPPGEHKIAKLGKSSKVAKEDDKASSKKKTYERIFKRTDQSDKVMMDAMGEPAKPKPEKKSDTHQLDWLKSPAAKSSHGIPDLESKRDSQFTSKNQLPDPNVTIIKPQAKRVTEAPSSAHCVPGISGQMSDLQPSAADSASPTLTTESNLLNKERNLQGVIDQVFGNIKRKYGRRDSMRTLNTHNSEVLWSKKAERGIEATTQSAVKERYVSGVDQPETENAEADNVSKKMEDEAKAFSVKQQTDKLKGRKRGSRQPQDDQISMGDLPMTQILEVEKSDEGTHEPKERQGNSSPAVPIVETNKERKNPVGRPRTMISSDKQTERRKSKIKERWSYLNSSNLHKDSCPVLTTEEPPSAYPITPASPLYSNTDSLTVITPIKKKRGRPKKQPLLTVETIHEGTATSPVSPISQESSGMSKKRRRTQDLSNLVKLALNSPNSAHQLKVHKSSNLGVFKKRTATKKMKLVKMQSILNELLSGASTSNHAPVSNAMSTVASTIEARLGKQINVSKRGTIYIGKKRGRKPRVDQQAQQNEHKASDKHSLPVFSQFENLVVPSIPSSMTGMPSPRAMLPLSPGAGGMLYPAATDTNQQDLKTMPNLQPISALPTKALKGMLSSNWKLSPPRLMANSPSHLSEVASIKEVTLSPVSESHSEETIPSDSGIGTDNNSTSDQAEKGSASRRRYSFDFCSFEATEAGALDATSKATRGHYPKHIATAAVGNFLAQESIKKQKHRRKRKGVQSRDDLQFLANLEELISKFQVFRISHRSYNFYRENSYPSIFRINFDHYYPMPYFPYDPVHYLHRNSDKSKRRRGRPAKSNEPMMKMPFIQGFGYPVPSGNYYAPYTMPYTSMPLATSMMNMGYYGQYPPPFYLPHGLGSATSPFMRPQIPPPKFHSSTHSKLMAPTRHRTKSMPHVMPSTGRSDAQPAYVAFKGGNSNMASVCLHKRKHKHKHKHKEEQYSISQREDLGGLFSGTSNPTVNLLNERVEKDSSLGKLKDKQRHQQSTDTLSRNPRSFFEVEPLSTLSLSDGQHCKHARGEPTDSFRNACIRQSHDRARPNQNRSLDLFSQQQVYSEQSGFRSRRHSLDGFGSYGAGSTMPFQDARKENTKQMFSDPTSAEPGSSLKRRYKRKEIEEIQSEVRKMHTFSKILSTKKNLDHVNKILKVKRLQRQSKTGNNIVKRRRGRPRKQPLPEEDGLCIQMPVLEKCVDLPGKRSLHSSLMAPEPLEFANHDSISAAIESVIHMARVQPKPQSEQADKPWQNSPFEGVERSRRGRGNRKDNGSSAGH
ncbi:SET-binding protein [Denticeps clupeoides]|uniref:SET-binding protein n=1 Tax=Denticeps clupeoides TaxID=299321 RepID=UPI0010A2F4D3|nr:SET-binding protein [Denticeps clupeoides]